MKLGHLKGSRVLPLGVSIVLVNLNGMVVILQDFISILVAWYHVVRPELGLVNHAKELFVTLGNALEPFPTSRSSRPFSFSIDCTGDRVVSGNDGEGFRSKLPILCDRIMAKLHERRWLPTKRINFQILLPRLNGRVDG